MAKAASRGRKKDDGEQQQVGDAAKAALAKVGDNSKSSDDDIKAVLLGDLNRSLESVASETGRHRNVIKRVQGKGIHVKAAKDVLNIKSAKQAEELFAYAEAVCDYMYITNQGFRKEQLDILRGLEKRQPDVERATVAGHFSAMRGEGEGKNPYAVESKQGQAWITAHRAAVVERHRILAAALAVGDETLIKGAHDGEADTVDDAESDEAEIEEAGESYVDPDDPGAELDPPNPDGEEHYGAVH